MFKPYFSLGFQERLFIVVPRVTEMQRCSDTRRLGARAEMRESLCERALGQCSLILTPTDSEFHWGHWERAIANELSNRVEKIS